MQLSGEILVLRKFAKACVFTAERGERERNITKKDGHSGENNGTAYSLYCNRFRSKTHLSLIIWQSSQHKPHVITDAQNPTCIHSRDYGGGRVYCLMQTLPSLLMYGPESWHVIASVNFTLHLILCDGMGSHIAKVLRSQPNHILLECEVDEYVKCSRWN